jgi:hypothetical protein
MKNLEVKNIRQCTKVETVILQVILELLKKDKYVNRVTKDLCQQVSSIIKFNMHTKNCFEEIRIIIDDKLKVLICPETLDWSELNLKDNTQVKEIVRFVKIFIHRNLDYEYVRHEKMFEEGELESIKG